MTLESLLADSVNATLLAINLPEVLRLSATVYCSMVWLNIWCRRMKHVTGRSNYRRGQRVVWDWQGVGGLTTKKGEIASGQQCCKKRLAALE